MRQVINLTQTTSASYLLMVSLDIARRNLALNGRDMFHKTVQFVNYAREEINRIGGYYAYGAELCNGNSFYAFDTTKLSIHTRNTGLAGIEVYDLLRDEYDIQIEFGDIGNILAIVTAGDRELEIERLISALSEIKRLYGGDATGMLNSEYIPPDVDFAATAGVFMQKKSVPLRIQCGTGLCRICDVLSAGHSNFGTGGTNYRGDCLLYFICKRKRLFADGFTGYDTCKLTGCEIE